MFAIEYRLAVLILDITSLHYLAESWSLRVLRLALYRNRSGNRVSDKNGFRKTEPLISISESDRIDLLCGTTTKTLSRGELVDFTQLTFVTGAAFMTFKGTNLMNNFNGKKIGVVKGTTTHAALKELLDDPEIKAEIALLNSMAEGLAAMEKGKIDAISADQVVLIGLALKSGRPENFTILPSLISYEPFALAVRRNDADFRLEADRVISHLYRSKKIMQIYNKWFGQFSIQMPTALEAMIQMNAIAE